MKMYKCLICALLVLMIGCQNSITDTALISTEQQNNDKEISLQDETLKNVAYTISKAMVSSPEFRGVIKDKALDKFDGDYDVLISHIINEKITDFALNKGEEKVSITVAELFKYLYPADARSTFQDDVLTEIADTFPTMQISVPVNIDKWEDGYIPTVVYIDSSFVENTTQYVQGIDAKGEYVWIDAINAPQEPVIVVGWNERTYIETDELLYDENTTRSTASNEVVTASNLVATLEGAHIRLNWQNNNGSPWHIAVYCSVNGGNYSMKGSTRGTTFLYQDTAPETRYDFYLKVVSSDGTTVTNSEVVTITTGNENVSNLASFSATPHNNTQVWLQWSQEDAANYDYVHIYRKLLSDNSSAGLGTLLASISNKNTRQYVDESATSGQKYLYTALNAKDGCVSNHKYDTIWKPFRNCSTIDSVYIKTISYDASQVATIESWVYGAPEFRVSTYTIPGDKTTASTRNSNKLFYFTSRDANSKTYNSDNFLFNWLPETTYDCMTIHMTEWDILNTNTTMTINVGVAAKTAIGDNIELSANAGVSVVKNKDDVDIGISQTFYFQEPNATMTFDNFGFAVTLNNTNKN